MNLDPQTLLFSLILTDVLMVLCMLIAVHGQEGKQKRDGMKKWAAAIFLDTLVWIAGDLHGIFPSGVVTVAAHVFKAASYAMMLMAIYEFQQRQAARWQYFVPLAAALVMAFVLVDDMRGRILWGSVIFLFQLALIARALLSDREMRTGRAWWLLSGGVYILMLMMVFRVLVAQFGHGAFAQAANGVALQPVQIIAFIAVMSASLLGSVGFILMVKERLERETMLLAMTDSLTHIPNRRALMERAEQLLARRSGAPLALLMIDVDHFKHVNDTYGHPVGDEVLRQLTGRLTGRLRGCDLLGRYGGEEFCVVTPDTCLEGALNLAESLRESIAAASFVTAGGALHLSISIGIARCPVNVTRALKDVLHEADSALYIAKESGRNKVVCFGNESV